MNINPIIKLREGLYGVFFRKRGSSIQIVKQHYANDRGVISICSRCMYLPKELIGKRIRVLIEVVEDKQEKLTGENDGNNKNN